MTAIRQRLPESVFDGVFEKVVSLLRERGLLKGKIVPVPLQFPEVVEDHALLDAAQEVDRTLLAGTGPVGEVDAGPVIDVEDPHPLWERHDGGRRV